MWVCVYVCSFVCVRASVCEVFCLLKNKQVKPNNDVSNEGRGESLYQSIYTSLGTCLHHRPGRSMFSEWTCWVVNGGARPPNASD